MAWSRFCFPCSSLGCSGSLHERRALQRNPLSVTEERAPTGTGSCQDGLDLPIARTGSRHQAFVQQSLPSVADQRVPAAVLAVAAVAAACAAAQVLLGILQLVPGTAAAAAAPTRVPGTWPEAADPAAAAGASLADLKVPVDASAAAADEATAWAEQSFRGNRPEAVLETSACVAVAADASAAADVPAAAGGASAAVDAWAAAVLQAHTD